MRWIFAVMMAMLSIIGIVSGITIKEWNIQAITGWACACLTEIELVKLKNKKGDR